ncbi:hypothetical protein RhiirC2_727167 [Rhizophagus irregularis]|uniref:Uncharacterized protein n=1 Tax=Rhizophagus irregularis TaxID=588596 RepID=A0A2N1NZY8_9GLOM|nr:hypothetical protein RhiirC2_727167 [Rhizophagus irregularis]
MLSTLRQYVINFTTYFIDFTAIRYQLYDNILSTLRQYVINFYGNTLSTLRQYFIDFTAIRYQLYDNILSTLRQIRHNFYNLITTANTTNPT